MTIQIKYPITTLALVLALSVGSPMLLAQEQSKKTDSLILNVGESKIIFLIRDHEDIRTMQDYDLNEILDQLGYKLTGDSTLIKDNKPVEAGTTIVQNMPEKQEAKNPEGHYEEKPKKEKKYPRGTKHSIDLYLGTNNYVTDGKFPDETDELYTVKPWGSWYVGINSIYKTRISGPLYVEWGGGVSWYNFKFDNTLVRVVDTPDEVIFTEIIPEPEIDYKKSKLTISYVNASFVPMIEIGKQHRTNKPFWRDWLTDNDKRGFRIGAGGYVGYRIASYTKTVEEIDDDKEKNRDKDSFHLENLRYGVRLRMGFKGTDVFFNYDLNELFNEGSGPQLNAFSFGVVF